MSTNGLEALEHTVQLTHIWINALDERLGWKSKPILANHLEEGLIQLGLSCEDYERRSTLTQIKANGPVIRASFTGAVTSDSTSTGPCGDCDFTICGSSLTRRISCEAFNFEGGEE